jgi:terminase small subunit-like protein
MRFARSRKSTVRSQLHRPRDQRRVGIAGQWSSIAALANCGRVYCGTDHKKSRQKTSLGRRAAADAAASAVHRGIPEVSRRDAGGTLRRLQREARSVHRLQFAEAAPRRYGDRAKMDKRAKRTEITQDRVLKEIARLAFSDVRATSDEAGHLKHPGELDDDAAAAIAAIEVVETARHR